MIAPHDQVTIAAQALVETRDLQPELGALKAPLSGLARDHRSSDFLGHDEIIVTHRRLVDCANKLGLGRVTRVGEARRAGASAAPSDDVAVAPSRGLARRVVQEQTHELLRYERGLTDSNSNITQVLDAGGGVCQDFAHLAIALLRSVGVPCRYVSGYLFQADQPEVESHARCEAFVPGLGWIGLDPTHGTSVDTGQVTVAAGRSYADVPPNRGVFHGSAQETIAARVRIEEATTARRGSLLPASRSTGALEAPVRRLYPRPAALEQEIQRSSPNVVGTRVQQQRQQQQ